MIDQSNILNSILEGDLSMKSPNNHKDTLLSTFDVNKNTFEDDRAS